MAAAASPVLPLWSGTAAECDPASGAAGEGRQGGMGRRWGEPIGSLAVANKRHGEESLRHI